MSHGIIKSLLHVTIECFQIKEFFKTWLYSLGLIKLINITNKLECAFKWTKQNKTKKTPRLLCWGVAGRGDCSEPNCKMAHGHLLWFVVTVRFKMSWRCGSVCEPCGCRPCGCSSSGVLVYETRAWAWKLLNGVIYFFIYSLMYFLHLSWGH